MNQNGAKTHKQCKTNGAKNAAKKIVKKWGQKDREKWGQKDCEKWGQKWGQKNGGKKRALAPAGAKVLLHEVGPTSLSHKPNFVKNEDFQKKMIQM